MGYTTFALEVEVQVTPRRLWHACVRDSHVCLPKALPEHVLSVKYVGAGVVGRGSVRHVSYGKAFVYQQCEETILEMDDASYYVKMKVVDGGVLDKLLHHHIHALQIVPGRKESSCYVRWSLEYDSLGDRRFHDAFKREAIPSIRVMEKYLQTHDDYAEI